MDILRVDQKNDQARVAVIQHIPEVSQQAERTIVVRDGGLRPSCIEAIGDCKVLSPYQGSRCEQGSGLKSDMAPEPRAASRAANQSSRASLMACSARSCVREQFANTLMCASKDHIK